MLYFLNPCDIYFLTVSFYFPSIFGVWSLPTMVVSGACVRVRKSEPYIYVDINGGKVCVIFKEGEIQLYCKPPIQVCYFPWIKTYQGKTVPPLRCWVETFLSGWKLNGIQFKPEKVIFCVWENANYTDYFCLSYCQFKLMYGAHAKRFFFLHHQVFISRSLSLQSAWSGRNLSNSADEETEA